MQDLSQAVVELSCFTDDACDSVHNTLQGISDRLRGSASTALHWSAREATNA